LPVCATGPGNNASEPYFSKEVVEDAQHQALPPSPARRGDHYVKAWDVGRKDASVCVVLRAPSREEPPIWHVVQYERLVGQDFPAIQAEMEKMHREYAGPTVIEDNSIGLPILQNLHLPAAELVPLHDYPDFEAGDADGDRDSSAGADAEDPPWFRPTSCRT
jgi:hypothetical protein